MACDECAVWAEVDGKRGLVTIRFENTDNLGIDPSTWRTLHRCRVCGTYYEMVDQRWFRELSVEEARGRYPTLVP